MAGQTADRRKAHQTGKRKRKAAPLGALHHAKPEESAEILRRLLDRHPELRSEAQALAAGEIADVDPSSVADLVEDAVLSLDIDDLGGRAGRHSAGYVEPTEAAWQLLQEAVEPFLTDLRREIELGFSDAAIATCQGIVLGLYRVRGKNCDQVLGWAPDFPAEHAGHAVAALARESAKRHGRSWLLSEEGVDGVPEWAAMIERASRGRR